MRNKLLGAAVSLASMCAQAQTMIESAIVLEPLVYSKDGNLRGCGAHLKFLEAASRASRAYGTVSVSIWLDHPGSGLLKGTFGTVTASDRGAPRVDSRRLVDFWIRQKGSDSIKMTGKQAGDDQSSLLGVGSFEASIDLIVALLDGAEVLAGMRPQGSPLETVLYGKVHAPDEEKRQLVSCFSELNDKLGKKR